ncbi:LytTR family DNA-binding domain-containing protein [uncultured Aquimarina sp.]|uniref:LytR/AlgR family response regulator transcription factor n=1 Tax=uncultured Aquimarina sp. TaxID=575652 RepID=UPI002636F1B4|nr:LytTR family DNA-binding domain-containing protein [uncultured Aquimarina sp.]
MKYSCLIVEDEPRAKDLIISYIEKIPYLQLSGSCNNAFDALAFLQKNNIDLIFLDIKMPQFTGMQLAKIVKENVKIIITTAYTEYAVESFELGITDYLLKPFSFDRFVQAVQRGLSPINSSNVEIETKREDFTFIIVKLNRNKVKKINLEDILYITTYGNYLKIYQQNDKMTITQETMKVMETLLPDKSFIRIHRCYLVSLNKIEEYTETNLKLNGQKFTIGKLYKRNVLKKMKETYFNRN